jgi:hypothetical protein
MAQQRYQPDSHQPPGRIAPENIQHVAPIRLFDPGEARILTRVLVGGGGEEAPPFGQLGGTKTASNFDLHCRRGRSALEHENNLCLLFI